MSDFDDSKHPRDERGRFAGSALGLWAKKTTKGPLEGFSAGLKGDLGAWAASKLPRSSLEVKTPWEKHVVEKHLTDLAFVRLSKELTASGRDTGMLDPHNIDDLNRGAVFLHTVVRQARDAQNEAAKSAYRAQNASTKANEARDSMKSKIEAHESNVKWWTDQSNALQNILDGKPGAEKELKDSGYLHPEDLISAMKTHPSGWSSNMIRAERQAKEDIDKFRRIAETERMDADLKQKKYLPPLEKKATQKLALKEKAFAKLGDMKARYETAQRALVIHDQVNRYMNDYVRLVDEDKKEKSDTRFEFSADKAGNVQLHVTGSMQDGSGTKDLVIDVNNDSKWSPRYVGPTKYGSNSMSWEPNPKEQLPNVHVTASYPPNEKGQPHPLDAEIEKRHDNDHHLEVVKQIRSFFIERAAQRATV